MATLKYTVSDAGRYSFAVADKKTGKKEKDAWSAPSFLHGHTINQYDPDRTKKWERRCRSSGITHTGGKPEPVSIRDGFLFADPAH